MRNLNRLGDWGLEVAQSAIDRLASRRYGRSPFCDAPLAPAAEYRRLWTEARQRSYPPVDRYEAECGIAIDSHWFHELALLTQVVIKRSPVCYQHGRLLHTTLARYARSRAHDHLNIVETGTARGFSALCLAKALDDTGATGKIVTFDVLPHDVEILWNCVRDAEGPRSRADLLRDYAPLLERYVIVHRGDTKRELAKMSFPRIHFAFLDSVHTYDHVKSEFESIGGRQRTGDILFFDDYTLEAYPGVVAAADEICASHGYSKTVVAADDRRRYLIAEKR